VLDRAGLRLDTPPEEREPVLQGLKMQIVELARDLHTGVPTLSDIFEQLVRPGRDPREDVPVPVLRSDVLSMSDLKTGMVLSGTVRNVVDFGAFIDIGVKQDGLLHRSQIPRGERLTVGNVLDVSILNVDEERGRIGLGWV
jgi:protein Tex